MRTGTGQGIWAWEYGNGNQTKNTGPGRGMRLGMGSRSGMGAGWDKECGDWEGVGSKGSDSRERGIMDMGNQDRESWGQFQGRGSLISCPTTSTRVSQCSQSHSAWGAQSPEQPQVLPRNPQLPGTQQPPHPREDYHMSPSLFLFNVSIFILVWGVLKGQRELKK